MNLKRDIAIAIIGLAFVMGAADTASAATTHPRRAEVNHRLNAENARINRNLAKGSITPAEAAQLHSEVRGIRAQERLDAAQHGGHITKAEQHQLNQEENAVSREIRQTAH
jgi:Skp family chaperone for outer membrane proteins